MASLLIVILSALFGGSIVASDTYAADEAAKEKVVYHINFDDPTQLTSTMRNIQNHVNAVGAENLDLRVVMHGKGVDLLKIAETDVNMQSEIVHLKEQSVKFYVCNYSITSRKINYETDLFDVTEGDIVPSGVAELAKLQSQGFAYIKP